MWPLQGHTSLNQLGNNYWVACERGHRGLNPDTDYCSGTFCLTAGLFSWQVHGLDDKNKSRMITSWLCNLNRRLTQGKVSTLSKSVLSLTWKVNGWLDLYQNKVLFGSKSTCKAASILLNLPKFFFRPRRISSSADQNQGLYNLTFFPFHSNSYSWHQRWESLISESPRN